MSSIAYLSAQQLRQAADLKEKITALENELSQLLGSPAKAVAAPSTVKTPKKKGGMSVAGKAKVAAAQKARWAKVKAAKSAPAAKPAFNVSKAVVAAKPAKRKFTMSAAAKTKISAAAKARWAKVKAEKK